MAREAPETPDLALSVRHVKRAAEALLGLDVGLIAGARQLSGRMRAVAAAKIGPIPAIEGLLADVPERLQPGDVRAFLPEDKLIADDLELRSIENKHRTAVLLECRAVYLACLAMQHGVPKNKVPTDATTNDDA